MKTRTVEFLEPVRHSGTEYPKGHATLPEELAKAFINLGWCKDSATDECGDRKPGANGPISIAKVTQKAK